jgi:uncharacterized protein (DUF2141 family)
MRYTIKICLVVLSFVALPPARAGTLIVEVRGFEDATGQAMVEVYSSRSGFLREPALSESQPLVAGEPVRWRFDDLAPSDYAVRVWHDGNANGEADRPTFGRNEAFAFSRGVTDPKPEWDDVTVMLGPVR